MQYAIQVETTPLEWERYVKLHSRSTAFHTWAWRTVLKNCGLEPCYLSAADNSGRVVAVFPIAIQNTRGFRMGTSLPFSDVGGPLVSDQCDPYQILQDFGKWLRLRTMILRIPAVIINGVTDGAVVTAAQKLGYRTSSNSGFFMLDLEALPPDKIWAEVFSRHAFQRKYIRRMDREGVVARLAENESDLSNFVVLHNQTVRNAGGKGHSYDFLRRIQNLMGQHYFQILLVEHEERLLAGLGFFTYPEMKLIHLMYGAYDGALRSPLDHTYLLAFWRVLNWAKTNGYSTINFGTTSADPLDGNFRFKRQFGGRFIPRYTIHEFLIPRMIYSALSRLSK